MYKTENISIFEKFHYLIRVEMTCRKNKLSLVQPIPIKRSCPIWHICLYGVLRIFLVAHKTQPSPNCSIRVGSEPKLRLVLGALALLFGFGCKKEKKVTSLNTTPPPLLLLCSQLGASHNPSAVSPSTDRRTPPSPISNTSGAQRHGRPLQEHRRRWP